MKPYPPNEVFKLMPTTNHDGFRIKSFADGTLFRARVERADGGEFQANEKSTRFWETPQQMDADTAIGAAIYAIDTGRVR
jgi:stalled ribosome alternative rescue factor ArfA